MIRVQVYLTEQQYQNLKVLSKKKTQPAAEIIRSLLDQGLRKEMKKNSAHALLRLADNATPSGIKDFSTSIDKYLYE